MMTLSVSKSISRIARMKIVLLSTKLSVSKSISRIARMKIVLLSTNFHTLWPNDEVEGFQVDLEDRPDENCVIIDWL